MKMFQCSGWQNVQQYSEKRASFPIEVCEYPQEHAHHAMGYTHARNASLEELVAGLKKAAGVKTLRYHVEEDRA